MGVTTSKESLNQEELMDDVSDEQAEPNEGLDTAKLAVLKAKITAQQKPEETAMPARIVEEKTRSIRFGVIGSGQAGSRIAERFYKLGYDSVAVNTAQQDLQHIEMPEANKLLLNYGLGGAGKELDIGHAAAEAYRDSINELVHKRLGNAQLLLFCTSLGGGSGAGSAETIVDLLTAMERPVAIITVLPMSTDDAQTKYNALQTLSKFTKMAQSRKIDNLIVVDNAKIETIYRDVGPLNFFRVSNEAIVEPIDQFNTLSSQASSVKGLDPTEFGKLFTDGQGLTIYGTMTVSNYAEETAIAEAVIDNLNGSLLASGFNLKETRYAGAIFVASKRVWDQIPNSSVNYAISMINDACGTPLGVFRGIYTVDTDSDVVKVYSLFSGLGLPSDRINQLKNEAKERMAQAGKKDEERNLALKLDAGEATISEAEAVKKRIQQKKSAFGKLHGRAIIDKRK